MGPESWIIIILCQPYVSGSHWEQAVWAGSSSHVPEVFLMHCFRKIKIISTCMFVRAWTDFNAVTNACKWVHVVMKNRVVFVNEFIFTFHFRNREVKMGNLGLGGGSPVDLGCVVVEIHVEHADDDEGEDGSHLVVIIMKKMVNIVLACCPLIPWGTRWWRWWSWWCCPPTPWGTCIQDRGSSQRVKPRGWNIWTQDANLKERDPWTNQRLFQQLSSKI